MLGNNTHYSKIGRITSTKTKKEAREIIARNYAIKNPILQKDSKYIPRMKHSNALYETYLRNTKNKREYGPKRVKAIETEIFPTEKRGKEEIEKVNRRLHNKSMLQMTFEKKAKQLRSTSSIKIFPKRGYESSMKNVLSESIDKDEHQRMKSLHENIGYRKRIVPVESTFKAGNLNGYIREQSKIMYQSGKFKKARTDHFNELMDNQSRYRDKDDDITIKPNNIDYSTIVNETLLNFRRRLYSDYHSVSNIQYTTYNNIYNKNYS